MDNPNLASIADPAINGSVPPVVSSPCASAAGSPSDADVKREEYRKKVVGTNIDTRSLLSTDYFNSFNSIVMMLDMLPDAPDLLEEVEQWRFVDYVDHFKASGLDFANLAVEAYSYSPPDLREAFERKIHTIRIVIEEVTHSLRHLLSTEEKDVFDNIARTAAAQLRTMIEEGNGLVHGSMTTSQADIDKLF